MKYRLQNIVISCIDILNSIIPKDEKRVIFYSFPDYSDNARAIYEEFLRYNLDKKYKVVWVVKDVNKYKNGIEKCKIVKHKSLLSLLYYVRSKYIIRTHSLFGNKYSIGKQIMCVAWHGMLIKGYSYSELESLDYTGHDHFCVTSELFRRIFSKMLNVDINKFDVTGFPRNDYLFRECDDLKELLSISGYKKVIIWMPTFRKYYGGEDGRSDGFALPTIVYEDLTEINEVLSNNNYLLLLKLHPWDLSRLGVIDFSNIKEIKNEDIPGEYTLYHLLGQMDAMISDYSSVWGDFLLLDRPIGFAYNDLEEYQTSRYIPLTPLEKYMPGMHMQNKGDLIRFIESLDKPDIYIDERRRIANLFIQDKDDNSSKRFLKAIGLL